MLCRHLSIVTCYDVQTMLHVFPEIFHMHDMCWYETDRSQGYNVQYEFEHCVYNGK